MDTVLYVLIFLFATLMAGCSTIPTPITGSVSLAWDLSTMPSFVTSYRVYEQAGLTPAVKVSEVTAPTTQALVAGIQFGVTYKFYVTAWSEWMNAESAPSSQTIYTGGE